MKLFKIHTEENGKDIDLGVHGVYADNEEDAIKYAETEIVTDFLSMGYKAEVGRTSKRSIIYGIIYVWDNEDIKYRKIIIWAIEKEKENTINDVYKIIGHYAKEIQQIIVWEKSNPLPANGFNVTNAVVTISRNEIIIVLLLKSSLVRTVSIMMKIFVR